MGCDCEATYEGEVDDPHRDTSMTGKVYVDAVNSKGAFEVPAGSKVLINAEPHMMVRTCRHCCVVRGQVNHWELEVS